MDSDLEACAPRMLVIRLGAAQGEDAKLVARSQARRLARQFKPHCEVDLDLEGVTLVGPAFADELFRAMAASQPGVRLTPVNMSRDVSRTITRAPSSLAGSN